MEGSIWRVERATTPFLESLSPGASSAFNDIISRAGDV
jgi:hypothetical protein